MRQNAFKCVKMRLLNVKHEALASRIMDLYGITEGNM
jgi:hypothetical protein